MKKILHLILSHLALCLALSAQSLTVSTTKEADSVERIAAAYLVSSLQKLYPGLRASLADGGGDFNVKLKLDKSLSPEEFCIKSSGNSALVSGGDSRGIASGIYRMLAKLGVSYNLDGDVILPKRESFSFALWNCRARPIFEERAVLNWHNFLTGCSAWELPKWKTYIEQVNKMGYNMLTVHSYGQYPTLVFSYKGVKKDYEFIPATNRRGGWAVQSINDVRKMHGGEVFDQSREYFGISDSQLPLQEQVAAAEKMLLDIFDIAKARGMYICFAFDADTPFSIQQKQVNANNTVNLQGFLKDNKTINVYPDPSSYNGYMFFKSMMRHILTKYPQVTHLMACSRRQGNGPSLWTMLGDIELSRLPKSWQDEFKRALPKIKALKKCYMKPERAYSYLIFAKALDAMRRATVELGRADIKWSYSCWQLDSMPIADIFMPKDVTFSHMDWCTKELAYGDDEYLKAVSKNRKVVPYFWPHHDDYALIVRPFTPNPELLDRLIKNGGDGFGVLHWLTHPNDIWFKYYADAIWNGGKGEKLEDAVRDFVLKNFGEGQCDEICDYLADFLRSAPQFGRETGDWFLGGVGGDERLDSHSKISATSKLMEDSARRIKKLEAIDLSKLTPAQKNEIFYFKHIENFVQKFAKDQSHYRAMEKFFAEKKREEAVAEIAKSTPIDTVKEYAKAVGFNKNEGELGVLVSLNTRWLPYHLSKKQECGLEPAKYNFTHTYHGYAQFPGSRSMFMTSDNSMYIACGEAELNYPISDAPKKARSAEGVCKAAEEIASSGIMLESEGSEAEFRLQSLTRGAYHSGAYELEFFAVNYGEDDAELEISNAGKALGTPAAKCDSGLFKSAKIQSLKVKAKLERANPFDLRLKLKKGQKLFIAGLHITKIGD